MGSACHSALQPGRMLPARTVGSYLTLAVWSRAVDASYLHRIYLLRALVARLVLQQSGVFVLANSLHGTLAD